MYVSTAIVKTQNASRYLQQLCKHWSHGFKVNFGAKAGQISFGGEGYMTLSADEHSLSLTLFNRDRSAVEAARASIEEHIDRFALKETLTFAWALSERIE